ncbi:LuxR C-terminal-related transcriptional regulator [Kribbella sp. VKM Ac-2568]|uniref:LuxR C-terminal-related transcriptional regulator n=1 Tax=Kribbella sp. VKM Ac-2568 TaxID=2512219 RepID=UPI00104E6E32|nr:LuxR C-terminal-related transcriptional regulator [Kribbella sp. VKM Ac-2568]TCM42578.1 DNA-binding CsgD family transcriptional regulator [Kribbella sp. VKM Ac-2568]
MSGYAKQRASDRIATLTRQGLDLVTLWQESSEAISSAVPYYQAPCWYTLDPASLLVTSHFNEGMPELPPEWLAQEYYADDVNQLADVARSERGISTLHEATGGDPASSPRWHQNMMLGGDQELIACLRTRSGEAWGALGLYREPGQPIFDDEDLAFIRAVAPVLATGARNSLLLGEATDPEDADAPGLIVINESWEIESATPGVERWLSNLPDGDWAAGRLPSSVLAVAGRALRTATYPDAGEVAVSRVMSRSGRWIVLHGTSLVSSSSRRVAVIVEPAHPGRIAPLLMAAYGLTDREQEVTRLVLQGNSTTDIAERLVVSGNTVQQHLKSVFDKTGVRSRRDLVGKIFFAHYEPRVRDNERRAADGAPLRGGPVVARPEL